MRRLHIVRLACLHVLRFQTHVSEAAEQQRGRTSSRTGTCRSRRPPPPPPSSPPSCPWPQPRGRPRRRHQRRGRPQQQGHHRLLRGHGGGGRAGRDVRAARVEHSHKCGLAGRGRSVCARRVAMGEEAPRRGEPHGQRCCKANHGIRILDKRRVLRTLQFHWALASALGAKHSTRGAWTVSSVTTEASDAAAFAKVARPWFPRAVAAVKLIPPRGLRPGVRVARARGLPEP
jgi:hypothetical protein